MGAVTTGAILDTGSDRSYCTSGLAEQLQAKGKPVSLTINTITSESEEMATEEVTLTVTNVGMRKSRSITIPKVLVVAKLPSALQTAVVEPHEVASWNHLRTVALQHPPKEVNVLIGLDAPEALTPLETRTGRSGEPFAVRTRLGWTINGPLKSRPTRQSRNTISHFGKVEILETPVAHFWEHESQYSTGEGDPISVEDTRVIKLWRATITQVKGHYQLPIPFRKVEPGLPNNKRLAEQRLMGLRRRLLRNPNLRERYREEMKRLVEEGHAEKVPPLELNNAPGMTWYLPHHPVVSPSKPGKVRIVFDCAATYKSISLNSQVMQGPDLNNKLLGVLIRFRQGQVALMADVQEMFHQVRVDPVHRDALRFLWWQDDQMAEEPVTYRMTAHLFGGVWSPSCAGYALRQTFEDFGKDLHEEVKRARHNFYVDDLLLSVDSPETAIIILHRLRQMLAKGGFRLTKWMCNRKEVLKTVPQTEKAVGVKEVFFEDDKLPVERALGILWDLEKDELGIRVQIPMKPETKRGLLSTINSLYDPLGLVAPNIIRAKIIFQEECKRGTGWDEPMAEQSRTAWRRWLEELHYLSRVRVSRCYQPKRTARPPIAQLHHFCDASQQAYGAVSYLRTTTEDGVHHVSFVCGKAKLAPSKRLTIPRLELCAAVMAVKLEEQLKGALDLQISRSVFWTDSTAVLQYIRNTERRFQTFVANRVVAIHESSRAEQ